jgi:hypothetical protein
MNTEAQRQVQPLSTFSQSLKLLAPSHVALLWFVLMCVLLQRHKSRPNNLEQCFCADVMSHAGGGVLAMHMGRYRKRLRHCGTSRKVAGSRPLEVIQVFLIYLILPAALGRGVYSASNRNEYQKHTNNFSGE